MWKVEKDGTKVEIVEDIYYMQHLLTYINYFIICMVVLKEQIYDFYKSIMSLAERKDRMEAVTLINKKLSVDEKPKQNFEKIVASVMKKYKNKQKTVKTDLEDKAIIENLYNIAKVLRTDDTLELYIFYMEMLAIDKDKRAKEVEHAYKQLSIERLEQLGLMTEEEASKKIAEIGKSYLVERVCRVMEEREIDEEDE